MRNFGSEDTRQVQRIVLQYEVFCEVLFVNLSNPLIAQLLEQWTVEFIDIHLSLVEFWLKGFFNFWFLIWCVAVQVSSQTGEDSTARDTQTDDIVMVNRWVQWPPEDLRGWGLDDGDDYDDVITSGDVANILLSDKESIGLAKFLQSASQVRFPYWEVQNFLDTKFLQWFQNFTRCWVTNGPLLI